jgi:hypothetical protein
MDLVAYPSPLPRRSISKVLEKIFSFVLTSGIFRGILKAKPIEQFVADQEHVWLSPSTTSQEN